MQVRCRLISIPTMKAANAVGKQRRPHGSIKGECVSIKLCLDTAWAVVLGGSSGKLITVGIRLVHRF